MRSENANKPTQSDKERQENKTDSATSSSSSSLTKTVGDKVAEGQSENSAKEKSVESAAIQEDVEFSYTGQHCDRALIKLLTSKDDVFEELMQDVLKKPEMSATSRMDEVKLYPNLAVPKYCFLLSHPDLADQYKSMVKEELLKVVKENLMDNLYTNLCDRLKMRADDKLVEEVKVKKQTILKQMNDDLAKMKANKAQLEARRDLSRDKAKLLCLSADVKPALKLYKWLIRKEKSKEKLRELYFDQLRVGIFAKNDGLIKATIISLERMFEAEGTLTQQNRLKAYKGYYALTRWEFDKAAPILLSLISTFRSFELMSQEKLFFYAVICSMLTMKRRVLLYDILKSGSAYPYLHRAPLLKAYIASLIDCNYVDFFRCLREIEKRLKFDHVLAENSLYYVTMMRIRAYEQLLTAYRNVKIDYIADLFGVSVNVIYRDLEMCIEARILKCTIDKISNTISMQREYAPGNQQSKMEKEAMRLERRMKMLMNRYANT